jgi:hypothetical protein
MPNFLSSIYIHKRALIIIICSHIVSSVLFKKGIGIKKKKNEMIKIFNEILKILYLFNL